MDFFSLVCLVGNRMNLQGYKTLWCHVIDDVGAGNTIDPGSDAVADAFNFVMVPIPGFEGLLCCGVVLQWVEPSTPCFIINSATPGPCRRIYLSLIASYPVRYFVVGAFIGSDAPELYARIHIGKHFQVKLQNEITIQFFRSQEGVGLSMHSCANDFSIFYSVFGLSIQLLEPAEVFAIEKGSPFAFLLCHCHCKQKARQHCHFNLHICNCNFYTPPNATNPPSTPMSVPFTNLDASLNR